MPGCPSCGADAVHPAIECPAAIDIPLGPLEFRGPRPVASTEVLARSLEPGNGVGMESLMKAGEKLAGVIWGLAKTGAGRMLTEDHCVRSVDLARQLIRVGELSPPLRLAHQLVAFSCRALEQRGLITVDWRPTDGTFTFVITEKGATATRVD